MEQVADRVAYERSLQLQRPNRRHKYLVEKLYWYVEDCINEFFSNDKKLFKREYVMIMDVVGHLAKRNNMHTDAVHRMCYIAEDDIDIFRKANINESIIMTVKNIYRSRGATLHDISRRSQSKKIVLQLVLKDNAEIIPMDSCRKRKRPSPHPYSPTSPPCSPKSAPYSPTSPSYSLTSSLYS